eukprot:1356733-Amorphochlora_amoeboformis.AAC.1
MLPPKKLRLLRKILDEILGNRYSPFPTPRKSKKSIEKKGEKKTERKSEKKSRTSKAEQAAWKQGCKDILNFLKAKEEAAPFLVPVDWQGEGLDDYPEIIKNPMDLGVKFTFYSVSIKGLGVRRCDGG